MSVFNSKTALLVLALSVAPMMAHAQSVGFFGAGGGGKAKPALAAPDMNPKGSGPLFSHDQLYGFALSGIKLGMTAEEAQKILTEKGFEGKFGFGSGKYANGDQTVANGGGTFENKIDQLELKIGTYLNPDDNTNRVYKVFFRQKFDTAQDIPTWKAKIKKRYGEEPTREEDHVIYYSDIPILKTGERVMAACSDFGEMKGTPACKNIEYPDGTRLLVEFPYDVRMDITLQDLRVVKEADAKMEAEKVQGQKDEAENAKENF